MRIDAITCCVGPMYAEQLSRSFPLWRDSLDSLTIVTKPRDKDVLKFRGPKNIKVITTDVFTQHGAHFNKGAALNYAYREANPSDWCLHFDSDIIPPTNWRNLAERRAKFGFLHGVYRDCSGRRRRIDERPLFPYGYFQMWNVNDPAVWHWPMFDTWHGHCGSYDADFAELWDRKHHRDLAFRVIHQGEARTNWFGETPDGPKLMKEIHRIGLYRYRQQAKLGLHGLKIPKPKLKLNFHSHNPTWIRQALHVCSTGGPFNVQAKVSNRASTGWESLNASTDLDALEERIEKVCRQT